MGHPECKSTYVNLTWRFVATSERITNISIVANAERQMISDITTSIDPTQTRTRVLALSVDAGLIGGTVRIDDALWPAVGRRANHLRQAGAAALTANVPRRVAVGSAGVGVTWVRNNRLKS